MKPNLLFICTDQQRRCAMSFWEKEEYSSALLGRSDPVHTPNLDALADEGIVVSEAYSSYPVCSPFRAMLFSGRYPEDNGVCQNCAPGRTDELRADIPTFTDILADHGFCVGYVGKWHLECPRADFNANGRYIEHPSENTEGRYYADGSPEDAPTCWDTLIRRDRQRGVDYLYAYNTYDVFRYQEGDDPLKLPRLFDKDYERHSPPPGVWSPDYETDVAIRFLRNAAGERDGEKPFALFVNYNPPHSPYTSREDTDYASYDTYYADAAPADRLPRRDNVTLHGDTFEEQARVYFSHVSGIDRCVGRLLDTLQACGMRENTIVVYTSDHGEMLGSHGRMSKNVPYEEATAIPFIIRYPARLAHRIEPLLLCPVDILPTILDLSGIDAPTGLVGTSYAELLLTGEGNRPTSAPYIHPKQKGVRTADYLFTVRATPEGEAADIQLFNLKEDPYQMTNLAKTDTAPDVLEMLRRELGAWLKRSNDPWYKQRLYRDVILYP